LAVGNGKTVKANALNHENVNTGFVRLEILTNLVRIEDRRLPEHSLETPHAPKDVLNLDDASDNDKCSSHTLEYLDFAHHRLTMFGFLVSVE
jgi:hypothetical protein